MPAAIAPKPFGPAGIQFDAMPAPVRSTEEKSPLDSISLSSRRVRQKPLNHSNYIGVTFDKGVRPWMASLLVGSEAVEIGRFLNEQDAARAYDEAALRCFGLKTRTNFGPQDRTFATSSEATGDEDIKVLKQKEAMLGIGKDGFVSIRTNVGGRSVARKLRRTSPSSKYRGVCWNKCNKSWKASIKVNGKNTHIGYFDNVHEAAYAYDLKAMQVRGTRAILNFMHEFQ